MKSPSSVNLAWRRFSPEVLSEDSASLLSYILAHSSSFKATPARGGIGNSGPMNENENLTSVLPVASNSNLPVTYLSRIEYFPGLIQESLVVFLGSGSAKRKKNWLSSLMVSVGGLGYSRSAGAGTNR